MSAVWGHISSKRAAADLDRKKTQVVRDLRMQGYSFTDIRLSADDNQVVVMQGENGEKNVTLLLKKQPQGGKDMYVLYEDQTRLSGRKSGGHVHVWVSPDMLARKLAR